MRHIYHAIEAIKEAAESLSTARTYIAEYFYAEDHFLRDIDNVLEDVDDALAHLRRKANREEAEIAEARSGEATK